MLLNILRDKLPSLHRHQESASEPLDPFAFWPHYRSALGGLGGSEKPEIEGYAFHTRYIRGEKSHLRFEIHLEGFSSEAGYLTIELVQKEPRRGTFSRRRLRKVRASDMKGRDGTVFEFVIRSRPDAIYALMGRVEGAEALGCSDMIITVQGATSPTQMKESLDAARNGFLMEPARGELAELVVNTPPNLRDPLSQGCTAVQMRSSIYAKLCRRLGQAPTTHRKQWEFAYILRVLDLFGVLTKNKRGLGFGVGVEPLPSAFAAVGCFVVATDLPSDDARAQLWDQTNQLGNLDRLHQPAICDAERFRKLVSFRHVDMTAIPEDLVDFDFTWSSCAFEHLGSIDNGLDFFEKSLNCLRPGGIAVHTTELNLSSNTDTLDHDSTVLFRRRDFERLALRLMAAGHRVIPLTFDPGDEDLDRHIDMPPYSDQNHLKVSLMSWTTTSFGMIVQKKQ